MANGKLVNTVNSIHRRSYMAGDLLRRSRRVVAILGVALVRKRLRCGFLELLSRTISTETPSSSFFFFLCFHRRRRCHRSGELASSPQRRCHLGKGRSSSVFLLRIHPANCGRLISLGIRCPRPSSLRPATAACVSSWPGLFGEPLPVISVSMASS